MGQSTEILLKINRLQNRKAKLSIDSILTAGMSSLYIPRNNISLHRLNLFRFDMPPLYILQITSQSTLFSIPPE